MALNKNSTTYVIGFVFVITVICALIIATAATLLKPAQIQQKEANIQKSVLDVASVKYTSSTLQKEFNNNIDVKYVDLNTGKPVNLADLKLKPADVEQILLLNKFKDYRTKLKTSENLPGLKDNLLSSIQKVYLVKPSPESKEYTKVILPFYGNGLWSVMYGLLAVDTKDGNTVQGIIYYQQGETPGLGGEVENPNFTKQFVGKEIYAAGEPKPLLSLEKSPKNEHQVAALTGASLTSAGVNNQLEFWLGNHGYAKFLHNLAICHASLFTDAEQCLAKGGN